MHGGDLTASQLKPLSQAVVRLGQPRQGKPKSKQCKPRAGTPAGGNAGQHGIIGLSKVRIRSEIAFMRLQVRRQRKEILLLQRAGISTTSAEALLQRMLDKIDGLCTQRDRLKAELPRPKGRVLGGRSW
jgi:hypothetical protein